MSASQAGCWIALDPGRHKCGLVRSDSKGERITDLLICSPRECWDWLQHWLEPGGMQGLVLGDGTSSSGWQDCIQGLDPNLQLQLQPEYASTLEARERLLAAVSAAGLAPVAAGGVTSAAAPGG